MKLKFSIICIMLSGLTGYSQLLEAPNLKFETVFGKKDSSGNKTGHWTFYRKDKSVSSKSFWKNGKREGATKYYWENGNIYVSVNYVDGKISGQEIFYYKDGSVAKATSYANGLKNGESKSYFNDGTIREIENYKEDVLHGTTISYVNGKIDGFVTYKNGIKHGKFQHYYNGTIHYEGEYQNGNRHGLWLERFVLDDEFKGKVNAEYKMVDGKLANPVKVYEYDEYGLYSDASETKRYYWLGNLELPTSDIFYGTSNAKRGEWNLYDENNNLIQRRTYNKTGEESAKWVFNKKGIVIEFDEDYKNGKSYKWNKYYDTGTLKTIYIKDINYKYIMIKKYYEDGNTKSYFENLKETDYYKSGKIKAKKEFIYRKEYLHIISSTEFHENGIIKVVKKYTGLTNKQGYPIEKGTWKYYSEEGKLIKTENYSNGKKQ